MAIQQGKPYWTSVFPQIEAWITNRPASTAASSEPVSEISSKAHRGDDFSTIDQIVSTKGSVFDIFEMHESIRVTANMADLAFAGCHCSHADHGCSHAADPRHNKKH